MTETIPNPLYFQNPWAFGGVERDPTSFPLGARFLIAPPPPLPIYREEISFSPSEDTPEDESSEEVLDAIDLDDADAYLASAVDEMVTAVLVVSHLLVVPLSLLFPLSSLRGTHTGVAGSGGAS